MSHPKKKWFTFAMAATLSVGTMLPQLYYPHNANAASADFTLRVLHTNDTHAHIDNVAKRITAIKENRNDNTILLDAGDVFSGTPYFTQFNGLADLEFMNMAGYNAMTPGNHEFDKGPATLEDFIKKANFPIVSANIDYSKNPGLTALFKNEVGGASGPAENGKIYPSIILNVNGEKVGVFGLTTEDTVALSSPGDTIKFQNAEQKAKDSVKSLTDKGITKIIALTHLGYDVDQKLAADVPGIDIIVGGHSHTKLDKPTVVDHNGDGPTLIVQTGEYGDYLGKLDATFDDAGKIKSYDGQLLTVADFSEDAEAKAKLKTYSDKLDELKKTVVGKTDVDLVYADPSNNRLVRKQETNLGDLITDGILSMTKDKIKDLLPANDLKDIKGYIGLQNGGGIRAGIKKGDITMGDVLTVMPFSNELVAEKVTGQELIEALENGVSDAPAEKGGFPHVSGMKFQYDPSKPKQVIDADKNTIVSPGERILDVQIQNADGSYSPIDRKAYYIVGTNSFTADGGDFYFSLKKAKNDGRYYDLNFPDYEVFTDYLNKTGNVDIKDEGRITTGTEYSPAYIASSLSIAAPEKDAAQLTMPKVPAGYSVSIKNSDQTAVIGNDGKITPSYLNTNVKLVLTVKKDADGSTADTAPIDVKVTGKTPDVKKTFTDVPETHWAYNVITDLASKNIVNGASNTSFEPDRAITRAEFTTWLVNALDLKTGDKTPFTDVSADKWYAQPISIAYHAGIVSGKSETTFDPNGKVTREEMVAMAMKAYKLSPNGDIPTGTSAAFEDQAKISPWAADAVKEAVALDLVHGRGSNMFAPQAVTTRAESAQVISKLLER